MRTSTNDLRLGRRRKVGDRVEVLVGTPQFPEGRQLANIVLGPHHPAQRLFLVGEERRRDCLKNKTTYVSTSQHFSK